MLLHRECDEAQLTDILVVVEEARSHLGGIAAAGNHHHHTEVDLEVDSRTLRDMFIR